MPKNNTKSRKTRQPRRAVGFDRRRTLINGTYTSVDSKNLKIYAIAESLKQTNSNHFSVPVDLGANISAGVLYQLGCDFSDEDINFSLLSEQTDEETVDNPNIFDKSSFDKTKNKNIESTKSFPNECDPFYELDQDISNSSIAKIQFRPGHKTSNIKVDVFARNMKNVKTRNPRISSRVTTNKALVRNIEPFVIPTEGDDIFMPKPNSAVWQDNHGIVNSAIWQDCHGLTCRKNNLIRLRTGQVALFTGFRLTTR
jgi:hypothetical protein